MCYTSFFFPFFFFFSTWPLETLRQPMWLILFMLVSRTLEAEVRTEKTPTCL